MAISDFAGLSVAETESWIDALASHGVDAVQIRAKTLPDSELEALTLRVVRIAAGRLRVLINGRADLAVASGADGVHLPSTGLPAAALRRHFPRLLLGLSTHHLEEVHAAAGVVDYVSFSPIYETPSKAAFGPAKGLAMLSRAAEIGVPIIALGGLDAERLPNVARAGAYGVAAIRALQDRRSLVEMAARAAQAFGLAGPH